MLDTYISRHESGPSEVRVNVTEKRAATDDSVRLLGEMEKAVQDRILKAIPIRDQQFECVILQQRMALDLGSKFIVCLSINGKKVQTEYRPPLSVNPPSVESIFEGLVKVISEKIAVEIIAPALTRTLSEVKFHGIG